MPNEAPYQPGNVIPEWRYILTHLGSRIALAAPALAYVFGFNPPKSRQEWATAGWIIFITLLGGAWSLQGRKQTTP